MTLVRASVAIRYAATSMAAGSGGMGSASTTASSGAPSLRRDTCPARTSNEGTSPSSSRAAGRRSSTMRRTSAIAARLSLRTAASSFGTSSGERGARLAAASADRATPVSRGPPSCSSRRSRHRSSSRAVTIRSRETCSCWESRVARTAMSRGPASSARTRTSAGARDASPERRPTMSSAPASRGTARVRTTSLPEEAITVPSTVTRHVGEAQRCPHLVQRLVEAGA